MVHVLPSITEAMLVCDIKHCLSNLSLEGCVPCSLEWYGQSGGRLFSSVTTDSKICHGAEVGLEWNLFMSADYGFEFHLHDALIFSLSVLNFSALFPCAAERLQIPATEDRISVTSGTCAGRLFVECLGNLPSERPHIMMWDTDVWVTALLSLAKIAARRLWGLNSKLFRLFSMGLRRTAPICRMSNCEEVAYLVL